MPTSREITGGSPRGSLAWHAPSLRSDDASLLDPLHREEERGREGSETGLGCGHGDVLDRAVVVRGDTDPLDGADD